MTFLRQKFVLSEHIACFRQVSNFFPYFLCLAVWVSCELQLTKNISIFFNKKKFNRKRNLKSRRFRISELKNRITKLSYAKWRHPSSYQLDFVKYWISLRVTNSKLKTKTCQFELLTQSWKMKSFTSSY